MEPNKQEKSKSDKSSVSYKVGDAVEKFGEKVADKGFKKTGDAIHKLGDKVEHLQDKKGSSK